MQIYKGPVEPAGSVATFQGEHPPQPIRAASRQISSTVRGCPKFSYVLVHTLGYLDYLDSLAMRKTLVVFTALAALGSDASSLRDRGILKGVVDPRPDVYPCCADMPSFSTLGQLSKPYVGMTRTGRYVPYLPISYKSRS